MRGEVGVRGLVRLEEVEDIAAAAEAGPVAAGAAGEHDCGCWLPPGALARIKADPDRGAAERVARGDLDRLLEHRGDSERVERAHRLDSVRLADEYGVAARAGRERVGNEDLAAGGVGVNEVEFANRPSASSISRPRSDARLPSSATSGWPPRAKAERIQR